EADDRAVGNGLLPLPMLVVLRASHQSLDYAEMIAQDMRDSGTGLAEADQDLEQFPNRASCAAGFRRQPQGAQPGLTDKVDRFIGKDALALAFAGAFGDVVQ